MARTKLVNDETLPTALSPLSLPPEEQDRLARILDDYITAAKRGTPISPAELLERHPNDARYLRGYVSGLQLFHAAAFHPSTSSDPISGSDDAIQPAIRLVRSAPSITKSTIWPRLTNAIINENQADPALALRRNRLRAAALCCLVWWTFIALNPLIGNFPWRAMPITIAALLAGAYSLLSFQITISRPLLKSIEVFVFGLMAAGFASIQFDFLSGAAANRDAAEIALIARNADIASLTILFPYAMLIPNSWKSALGMILVLALYPLVVTAVFLWTHPEAQALTGKLFEEGPLSVFKTIIAAGLSLFGVHVLDTLRAEVFEARRLNQYQLGKLIGSGGMGDVYLAEHRLLKRPCAVKLIRQEAAGDRKTLEGFEREVRSTARLSHPNIIEIFDYGHTNDQTFYYVMEYLNGLTFAELISQFGRQPGGRVAYLLSQAAAGLAEAHASGLIHRDLKPSNISAAQIGQRFDVVKIFDFGLVKNTRDLQTQGVEIAGTPMYMAPEQITAPEEIDRRADLYAIGAIGYHLLTGEPPFKVEKIIDLMLSHVNAPVMSPTQLHSDIPTDLEAVVLKCLAKQPCDRFEDAEQLRTAILSCSCAGEWDERKAREWWNSPSTYKGISETYDMRRVK